MKKLVTLLFIVCVALGAVNAQNTTTLYLDLRGSQWNDNLSARFQARLWVDSPFQEYWAPTFQLVSGTTNIYQTTIPADVAWTHIIVLRRYSQHADGSWSYANTSGNVDFDLAKNSVVVTGWGGAANSSMADFALEPITIKLDARTVPVSWTDVRFFAHGHASGFFLPERRGNWYVHTFDNVEFVNILFADGTTWSGAGQTAPDALNVTVSTCYAIGTQTSTNPPRWGWNVVDCPEPSVVLTAPSWVFDDETIAFSASSEHFTNPDYSFSVLEPGSDIFVSTPSSPFQPTEIGIHRFAVSVVESDNSSVTATDTVDVLVAVVPVPTIVRLNAASIPDNWVGEDVRFYAWGETQKDGFQTPTLTTDGVWYEFEFERTLSLNVIFTNIDDWEQNGGGANNNPYATLNVENLTIGETHCFEIAPVRPSDTRWMAQPIDCDIEPITIRVRFGLDVETWDNVYFFVWYAGRDGIFVKPNYLNGWFYYEFKDRHLVNFLVSDANPFSDEPPTHNQTLDFSTYATLCFEILDGVDNLSFLLNVIPCPNYIGTGIEQPERQQVLIFADNGIIHAQFEGRAQVELFSITGQLLRSEIVENRFAHPAPRGIYLLRVNGQAHKVVVQ